MRAVITIDDDSEKLISALKPEKKDAKSDRASYTIKKEKDKVIIEVTAKDPTAFRASLNSISKLLVVFYKAENI